MLSSVIKYDKCYKYRTEAAPVISWSICGPKPNVVCATRHEKVTISAKERGS